MISLGIIPVFSGATFGILRTGTATFSIEELQKMDWTLRFWDQVNLVLHMVSCCWISEITSLKQPNSINWSQLPWDLGFDYFLGLAWMQPFYRPFFPIASTYTCSEAATYLCTFSDYCFVATIHVYIMHNSLLNMLFVKYWARLLMAITFWKVPVRPKVLSLLLNSGDLLLPLLSSFRFCYVVIFCHPTNQINYKSEGIDHHGK